MTEFNNGKDFYIEGKYIQLYQKYFTEGDQQQLTPKELHTTLILKNISTTLNDNLVITTLNLLGHLIPFANRTEAKKNAAVARDILRSLKAKNIITYEEPKDNNTPFEIWIEPVKYVENDKRTNFVSIPRFIFERTNEPDELYVLIVVYNVARWDDKGDNGNPYFRNKKDWGGLLNKGNTAAEKVINRMIKKGILFYYESECSYNHEKSKFDQKAGRYYLFPQKHEDL
jgi:hypothetical protein